MRRKRGCQSFIIKQGEKIYRIANLLLAIMLLFTLTGCGSNTTNEDTGRKDAEKIIEDNMDTTVQSQENSSSKEGSINSYPIA